MSNVDIVRCIKIKTAKHQFEMRSRHVLKKNSLRFAAALLAALASFVAGPNAAQPAAPQHYDQAPGFYRLKVGELEVTALFDGAGVFDPHWLNGTKATMDGVVKATINGTRSSKATITTLMTQGPKAPFTDTGT